MNMKNTITFTAEITVIYGDNTAMPNAEFLESKLKNALEADDVHIKNLKVFEGTEGGHE